MAGFQIGTNTSTSMPVFPDFVQKPMENFYGALGTTGMLGGANGWKSSLAPWNTNLGGAYDAAGGMLSGNQNWAGKIAGSGQITPESISQFANPYAQAVGDGTMKAISDSYSNRDADAAARAASGVAFGGAGSGLALERAQNARNEATDKAAAMRGILSDSYGQGAQIAGQNAGNSLQAAIGADNAQSNFQQRGQGALSALLQTGQMRQGYDQGVADLPYTDLTRFLQLLSGSPQGTQQQTPVTFDPISLLLGLGSLAW